ncbi:TIM barrel protein [Pontibacter sp. G13]|uniref:hydroxypyruvate isomerase family protein n=1 Tax=Pontibacter sp. G13 TaxID=3074898 RepID=UPI00288944E9|nr:TIM barrel protein [Pontibacter sp. G13]WNJ17505.1 TIM barrel protein [Pontibacter sp. G13]
MNRRNFVKTGLAGAAAAGIPIGETIAQSLDQQDAKPFKLKFAPHIGMFKHSAGDNPVDQLKFMADQGFHAFEDNGMKKRPIEEQKAMAKVMEKRGIEMGVFVAHQIYWKKPTLTSGKEADREEFLTHIRESVEVAKRVNAKWMTVVPGYVDMRQQMGYQTAHVVETLRRASEILEPHDLVMVLEPLNFLNHPGLFLSEMPQAYQICRAVDSPSCKILCDLYHQQITEGNLIPNVDASWDEIAYFQIGDNPGRKEPTTGEINYANIFKHIHQKGFRGILGMEHGNSREGKEGEQAVIDAYRQVDLPDSAE